MTFLFITAHDHWALTAYTESFFHSKRKYQMEWKIKCRKHIFTHFSSVCSLLCAIFDFRGLEFYPTIFAHTPNFRRVNVRRIYERIREKKLKTVKVSNEKFISFISFIRHFSDCFIHFFFIFSDSAMASYGSERKKIQQIKNRSHYMICV